jgi:hypothetical protein
VEFVGIAKTSMLKVKKSYTLKLSADAEIPIKTPNNGMSR